ncbi:type II CAAX endopeptidase family protein [uncultured Winogradskyella sp.]|uniref:CPBP family intramembrane glutamic endopeptidase n=1 Tax=uncultured Winogradskyella sp. TaxID=395353 RepID=UPI00260674A6|nr:type II CAAX endopeptidase family protein [uncultured Winogradskyella sp.]
MNRHFLNLIFAIVATLLYIIINELIGIWTIIAELLNFQEYYKYYVLIQGSIQTIIVLTFIFFIKHKTFKGLTLKTEKKWYLSALALGLSFVYIQALLKWIYNFIFDTNYYILYDLDGLLKTWNINYLSLIIFIPIAEEMFFREYIQNKLQKKTNNFVAIIFASFLFALIHSPYLNLFFNDFQQTWHLTYLTFFGGLLSGLIYYKSRSIGPSIVFHVSWNLMAQIL